MTPRPVASRNDVRDKQAGRIAFLVGLVMSAAAWDEGHSGLAAVLPFLAAGVGMLIVRIYETSELPRVEWKPGDDPPPRSRPL